MTWRTNPDSQQNAEIGTRYSWYVLGVLVIVYVFNFIDRQILSILNEEIQRDLGLNDAETGFSLRHCVRGLLCRFWHPSFAPGRCLGGARASFRSVCFSGVQ